MDWRALTLFLLVLARMSGVVLFNPILGRQSIPGVVKSGFILLLSITAYTMTDYLPEAPGSILETLVLLGLELFLGYVLGLVMNLFFYVPLLGGETIDMQMGMSMGRTYDPSSQTSTTVTASLLNLLLMLLFFAANGHQTLLRIILVSGRIVPFGAAAFGQELYGAMVELFINCTILGIKLCMPILAAELLGQMGMGILMKVIPQINVFAINIELKVIIGLGLLFLMLVPFSEFLLGMEADMLRAIQRMLLMMGG
ncbi:MAG: flagellar biosynthetic protein FliR [Oscillospiraceae bacterium]|jgi:flagellar biosynthetic protein FliR|nr:flagellar biosynthetic protein FliR [Oscillospiraceae bacterium]MCI9391149.1 flagellar biosynthetic protein FliR [Oscillospiraceae bacterium]